MEDDHRTDNPSIAAVNGRGRVLDGGLPPVPADQNAIRVERDGLVPLHRLCQRVGCGETCGSVDDTEYVRNGKARGFLAVPASHLLCHHVQISHSVVEVYAEHRVANRVERHLRAFLFDEEHLLCCVSFIEVPQRLDEGIAVEM